MKKIQKTKIERPSPNAYKSLSNWPSFYVYENEVEKFFGGAITLHEVLAMEAQAREQYKENLEFLQEDPGVEFPTRVATGGFIAKHPNQDAEGTMLDGVIVADQRRGWDALSLARFIEVRRG